MSSAARDSWEEKASALNIVVTGFQRICIPSITAWPASRNVPKSTPEFDERRNAVRLFRRHAKHERDVAEGFWGAYVIALDLVACLAFEECHLLCRFHALYGDAHAERIAEQDDRTHDRMRFPMIHNVVHEGLVDL